jgi:glutathione-regulated potassium-efflux system ancillary protein KefC
MSGSESMLVDAIVYLGAAAICVPLASRTKLGSVLGYLGAGCVIGPFGFELVGDPQATMHFAEIGVVLMLFLIGLELDPKHLWTLRKPVFGGGSLQIATCGFAFTAALWLLGVPWQGALVAGVAVALSSTAVAMQTMSEHNLLKTNVGQVSFAVLLFQDIAAIPLLAIVPLLAESTGDGGSGWLGALKVFGSVAAVIVIGRFLTRPVLRLIAQTGLREVFTGFTLLLVLGIAELMSRAGVSMALGAFLAGVLLAGSEYRHALETDIAPFKGLLMGLFFIAVGMSIDFGLLATEPLTVFGLVIGYQVLKVVILRAIGKGLGVEAPQRWLLAALLAQGGEFAFVVFGVARSAKLLPGDWDALLTLTVALSMALTPVLLILERAMRPREPERSPDAIEETDAQVIVAGFGRFGQIVGRLLFASGMKATVLDLSPTQIEILKRFDFRVYYGDASRLDLLEAAGAARAKVLVNAIDDPETSLRLVDAVKEHFPHLRIVARARNVGHYSELRARGVEIVTRETFESALLLGRRTLEALGIGPYEARETADQFRRQNIASIEAILPHWHDEKKRIAMARTARQDLERQMELDRARLEQQHGHGWHDRDDKE